MFRFLLMFFFSYNVIASQEDSNVRDIQQKLLDTNSSFEILNKKVEVAIIANEKLIKENSRLVNSLNSTINSQNKNQLKFVKALNELKEAKEKKTDLEFEIATDVPYVVTVILSILTSVLVTWLLLQKDSRSNHNRLLKEFRQKWVNDFRDTTSSYVDIVSQIETYQHNNLSFYLTRHSLIELKKEFDEEIKKIDNKQLGRKDAVLAKWKARQEWQKLAYENETDSYQKKNAEYLKLLSSAKILESKLRLLLKPEFSEEDSLDKEVFRAMKQLREYVHSPQGRHSIINSGSLAMLSETLLDKTQYLLKTEWDRIKVSE